MPSKRAIITELEEVENTLKRYSSTNTFAYSYDEHTNKVRVNYTGCGFPAEIESLMNRTDSTVHTFSIDASTTIKIVIRPGSNVNAILNELNWVESTMAQYSSTNKFKYGHDNDLTGEIRVLYDGDEFPDEIVDLLTRDDSWVSAFYSDGPLRVETAITPRRLPSHD